MFLHLHFSTIIKPEGDSRDPTGRSLYSKQNSHVVGEGSDNGSQKSY